MIEDREDRDVDETPLAERFVVTLYIVQTGGWAPDVSGCLVDPADGILWSHVSSDREWLVRDLTVGFAHRKADLEARYPAGYTVIEVEPGTATSVEPISRFFEHRVSEVPSDAR